MSRFVRARRGGFGDLARARVRVFGRAAGFLVCVQARHCVSSPFCGLLKPIPSSTLFIYISPPFLPEVCRSAREAAREEGGMESRRAAGPSLSFSESCVCSPFRLLPRQKPRQRCQKREEFEKRALVAAGVFPELSVFPSLAVPP